MTSFGGLYGPSISAALERAGSRYPQKMAWCTASIGQRSNQTISGTIQLVPTNHFHKLQALRGCPFQIVAMDGQGGTHASAAVARFAANVAAYGPEMVFLGADLAGNQINAGGTAADTWADMLTLIRYVKAIPAIPVIATLPPNVKLYSTLAYDAVEGAAGGTETAAKTYNLATIAYNKLVRAYAKDNPDVILHVWGERNVDHTRVDGHYVQKYSTGAASTDYSPDGTHQHPRYAWDLALDVDAALGNTVREDTLPFSQSNLDPDKWVLNPTLLGTAGSVSSGASSSSVIVSNCSLSGGGLTTGSCVGNRVARDDGIAGGYWQEIVITASDRNATFTFTGVGSSALPVGYDITNDAVFGAVEIRVVDTPINLRNITIGVNYAASGAKTLGGESASETGGFAQIADAGLYIPRNRTLTFPTAINKLTGLTSITSITVTATKSSVGNMTTRFYIGRPVVAKNPFGVPFVAETPATP